MMTKFNIGKEISEVVEAVLFDHRSFNAAFFKIKKRIDATLAGDTACFEMLRGFSRCGKTELLKKIAREYPETVLDGRRVVPVLIVPLMSATVLRGMPIDVITALNLPIPKGEVSAKALNARMFTQLKLAGVKVILFDEANHLVDIGTTIPARAISDWFKCFHDKEQHFGVVIAGLPCIIQLQKKNEQVFFRMDKPISLFPYRYDDSTERKAFSSCVGGFLHEFTIRGCTLDMGMNDFVRHCYLASAGHVGLLARFFLKLAELIKRKRTIPKNLCARACANLNLPGGGFSRPFVVEQPSDSDLMQVLSFEYDRYSMALPPIMTTTAVSKVTKL